MIEHPSKLPNLETTIFTTMGKLAAKYGAVNLSQGFPDFGIDPKLMGLVEKALKEGHNQYAPMQGIYPLREQIAQKIESLYGKAYHPESEITVTAGATQAIFTALSAFVRPNDEVIVFKPAYDCYEPAIALYGGKVIPVQLSKEGFKVDWSTLEHKISKKTKMVIINTPHNPTGTVLDRDDMLKLQEILRGSNIILLSDEVYEHIIFDGRVHESASKFPDLARRSLICASFGKTFHVTGWKLGYVLGPKELMGEFQKVHQYTVFCANHPMQRAIANYLKEGEPYLGLRSFYGEKRDYFLGSIASSAFCCTPSKGTYFQVLDYSGITDENDIDFSKRLVKEHKIASIPLSIFNLDRQDHKQLRFCFAKTRETLDRASEILNKL